MSLKKANCLKLLKYILSLYLTYTCGDCILSGLKKDKIILWPSLFLFKILLQYRARLITIHHMLFSAVYSLTRYYYWHNLTRYRWIYMYLIQHKTACNEIICQSSLVFSIQNNLSKYRCNSLNSAKINTMKVRKTAKIRNQYNQVPHLTQDTTWESDKISI